MYAVLTVSDENTYRRLPSTGPYSVSKFEMAIRIGLAPVGPMLVSDRLTDSRTLFYSTVLPVKVIPKSFFFFLAMMNGMIITICYSKLPPALGTISGTNTTYESTGYDSTPDQKTSCMPDLPWKMKLHVIKKEEK